MVRKSSNTTTPIATPRTLPRAMAILSPIRVIISDIVQINPIYIEVPDFPSDPKNSPRHLVPLEKELFIESEDFREECDDPHFRGLTPKQVVGLKHAGCAIELKSIHRKDGCIDIDYLEVIRHPLESLTQKPKCFIQWVSAPLTAEIRLNSKNVEEELPMNGFPVDSDLNNNYDDPVKKYAYVEISLRYAQPNQQYYFERVGAFSVEPDSRMGRLVFRTEPWIAAKRLGKVEQDRCITM